MFLYHTLSCKKYISGFITSSAIPSNVDISIVAPNIKAVITVVSVPNILYDIVFSICLINTDFSFWVVI